LTDFLQIEYKAEETSTLLLPFSRAKNPKIKICCKYRGKITFTWFFSSENTNLSNTILD